MGILDGDNSTYESSFVVSRLLFNSQILQNKKIKKNTLWFCYILTIFSLIFINLRLNVMIKIFEYLKKHNSTNL